MCGREPREGRALTRAERTTAWLHVAAIVALSTAYEALFVRRGLNALDEGWPLYAAMQLHQGGTLYRDVFFVFPPGHALAAWVGYAWDPPGIVFARVVYAGFNVAMCVLLYLLGRRLMPPAGALLAAALLAVAAGDSHGSQYLFGYRYLVFSAASLWCYAEHLRTGERRWMIAAGALVGVALLFRLDPAVAAIGGIGAAVLVAERRWRNVSEQAVYLAIGFAAVVLPVLAWLALGAGLDAVWREAVVRPFAMTDQQSLPVPALYLPETWRRWEIRWSFVTLQFRLWTLMYAIYAVVLASAVVRSLRARQPFRNPLLLAVVVWGGLFFLRAFGRADEAHLDSALPPVCLLLAYAACAPLGSALARVDGRRAAAWAGLVALFGAWVFLTAADRYVTLGGSFWRPVETLGGRVEMLPGTRFHNFDRMVREIRERTDPGDVVLDLTASSLLHVVSGRAGPGRADVVMPGTFLDAAEERAFLAPLERSPPRLAILPVEPFDRMAARYSIHWAPELTRFVLERYVPAARIPPWILMARQTGPRDPSPDPSGVSD